MHIFHLSFIRGRFDGHTNLKHIPFSGGKEEGSGGVGQGGGGERGVGQRM